ncbi:hypothetical protein [Methylobacterium sp. NFXW15]|uniref:hypothetical protein n=1 Tax=Methylobacterium sp. NFXW15 TaxID=2819512 RepID=UPI003CF1453A
MLVRHIAVSAAFLTGLTGAALAQTSPAQPPASSAPVVAPQSGSTGSPNAATISPNGNPADTVTTNSSAGGNAGQPSRAVPQGGGNSK